MSGGGSDANDPLAAAGQGERDGRALGTIGPSEPFVVEAS